MISIFSAAALLIVGFVGGFAAETMAGGGLSDALRLQSQSSSSSTATPSPRAAPVADGTCLAIVLVSQTMARHVPVADGTCLAIVWDTRTDRLEPVHIVKDCSSSTASLRVTKHLGRATTSQWLADDTSCGTSKTTYGYNGTRYCVDQVANLGQCFMFSSDYKQLQMLPVSCRATPIDGYPNLERVTSIILPGGSCPDSGLGIEAHDTLACLSAVKGETK